MALIDPNTTRFITAGGTVEIDGEQVTLCEGKVVDTRRFPLRELDAAGITSEPFPPKRR